MSREQNELHRHVQESLADREAMREWIRRAQQTSPWIDVTEHDWERYGHLSIEEWLQDMRLDGDDDDPRDDDPRDDWWEEEIWESPNITLWEVLRDARENQDWPRRPAGSNYGSVTMNQFSDSDDRATIADLELYGLSLRWINSLEEHLGLLYVDELTRITEADLSKVPYFGPSAIWQLRAALQNWLNERPLKTVEECVEM